jgi:hypothetical protein
MFYSFIPRTVEDDYIAILKNASLEGGEGCWSKLGKRGGRQPLSLSTGCTYDVGTPIHEFMHALGNKTLYKLHKIHKKSENLSLNPCPVLVAFL